MLKLCAWMLNIFAVWISFFHAWITIFSCFCMVRTLEITFTRTLFRGEKKIIKRKKLVGLIAGLCPIPFGLEGYSSRSYIVWSGQPKWMIIVQKQNNKTEDFCYRSSPKPVTPLFDSSLSQVYSDQRAIAQLLRILQYALSDFLNCMAKQMIIVSVLGVQVLRGASKHAHWLLLFSAIPFL